MDGIEIDVKMEDAKKLIKLERQEKVDKSIEDKLIKSIETTAKNNDKNVELPKPKKIDGQREEQTTASDIKQNEKLDNYSEGSVKTSLTN